LVGEETDRIGEVEEAIVRAFGWAFGVTVVLGAMGGGVLSLGFLRRVDAINRTSRAIIEGRLAERVRTRGTGDELDRLALNLNEMLDRVQALMESLRQVSSDIAHDLRTPLSHLRQRLEGARSKARRIEDYETVVDQAISDTDAILATFAALLRIAQIEAGTRKAAFSTVDLSRIFQSITDAYGAVAEDRGQRLAVAIEPGLSVRGDRELLTQMLANLVENAIRHTPEGTRIQLALEQSPTGPVGIIADDGPGIPAEARDKVFRRFFRLERSRSTAGSGLGLSLVAAVADIHVIAITLADNEPGLKAVLDFPHA
jgi:signal transduction histidine kinase